jgi:hypothetical protein
MQGYKGNRIILVAFAATLVNLLPMLLGKPGADVLFHYALIECFSSQFWQGDLYPRWCADANSGLGSPVFLFYFPLPYYITALFYPLHYLGVDVQGQYALSVAAATLVTFLTSYAWLRDRVTAGRALLCAMLLLFMPYRMEVMYFRTALAELWGFAFLPLLFLYARHVAVRKPHAWRHLTGAIMLAMLSHVPLAFIGLIGCTLLMARMARFSLRRWLAFMGAGISAAAAIALYLVPAKFYMRYLHEDALAFMRSVWVNDYLSVSEGMGRISVMVNLLVTLLLLACLLFMTLRRRTQIADSYSRREMMGWAAISVVALLLMLPLSAPLWNIFYSASGIMTPWRAQALIPFALVYLLAMKMQWMMSQKQLKTWKADYGVLLGLFMLLSLTVLTTRPPEVENLYKLAIDSQVINASEYRSRWSDKIYADREELIRRFEKSGSKRTLSIIEGDGGANLEILNSQQIVIHTDAAAESVIELTHFYFPIWQVSVDNKPADILFPAEKSGFMRLRVPAGEHEIVLNRDLAYGMGLFYTAASFAAFLSITLLFYLTFRKRRTHAV